MLIKLDDGSVNSMIEALRLHAFDDCGGKDLPTHICNIAADMLAALRALPVSDGWEDMSSAPETGETILVYRPDAGVFTAHYVEEDAHLSSAMNPPEGDFFWFTTGGEDLTDDMPTHWRPLPAPPTIE